MIHASGELPAGRAMDAGVDAPPGPAAWVGAGDVVVLLDGDCCPAPGSGPEVEVWPLAPEAWDELVLGVAATVWPPDVWLLVVEAGVVTCSTADSDWPPPIATSV